MTSDEEKFSNLINSQVSTPASDYDPITLITVPYNPDDPSHHENLNSNLDNIDQSLKNSSSPSNQLITKIIEFIQENQLYFIITGAVLIFLLLLSCVSCWYKKCCRCCCSSNEPNDRYDPPENEDMLKDDADNYENLNYINKQTLDGHVGTINGPVLNEPKPPQPTPRKSLSPDFSKT